jgi:hypothetical protein
MSRRIAVACICWIFFLAAFVVSGCSPEGGTAQAVATVGVAKADVERDAAQKRSTVTDPEIRCGPEEARLC